MGDGQTVGERLRAARAATGLSQHAAAKKAGVHKASVLRWEADERAVSAADLAKLARVYGTTVGALLGEAGSQAATTGAANESAPSIAEGAERAADLISEAERSVAFWIGKQQGLLQVMEYVQTLQQNAADMQGKAIDAQREIIGRTIPMPAEDAADRERRIAAAVAEEERRARERQQQGAAARHAAGGRSRGGGVRRRMPRPDSPA